MKATEVLFLTVTMILIGAATVSTFKVLSETRPAVMAMIQTNGGK